MATMTFQINDASAGGTNPAVWVTITENADGTLTFGVTQQGGLVGDLRGIFFDVADESLLSSLVVSANSTDIRVGDDSVKDLGDGANMNGLLGSDRGYDVGIEIGSAGIGKDDVRSYSFTLDSTARDLTLADFAHVDFGVRLTSVGIVGGARADSSKLLENTSAAIELNDVQATVDENAATHGNVLDDVSYSGTSVVTGWTGGAVGAQVVLESEGDVVGTLALNADGSYVVDASMADALSAGESIVYNFAYDAKNQDEATSWSNDSARFTVVVNGVNDGPDARDDSAGSIAEDATASGNVLANDTDIDRLDVLQVAAVNGVTDGGEGDLSEAVGVVSVQLASGAVVSVKADGSYDYDTNGAFGALNDGQTAQDEFEYTAADGHGGYDTAKVGLTILGAGSPVVDPEDPQDPKQPLDLFPTMAQALSNVVLYLDDGDASTKMLKLKIEPSSGDVHDIDALNISDVLTSHAGVVGANTNLLGISVHAGQEYPNAAAYDMTAPGEGAFYFLGDGETPVITPIGSRAEQGWAQDWTNDDIPLTAQALAAGFSYDLLQQQADVVFVV